MKRLRLVRMSVVIASLLGTVVFVAAQEASSPSQTKRFDLGRAEYRARCATCHGLTGKGDGSMAAYLTRKVPDLTTLAKNNNGILPITEMYLVITGDTELPGHGTREMPVWGNAYRIEAGQHYFEWPYDIEGYVRVRILALIEYIDRLQAR
jgi:mono/diheme cytochrome c family protein